MNDEITQLLRRAKAIAENEPKTRQVSLVITKIDEAILWGEFAVDESWIGAAKMHQHARNLPRTSRGPG